MSLSTVNDSLIQQNIPKIPKAAPCSKRQQRKENKDDAAKAEKQEEEQHEDGNEEEAREREIKEKMENLSYLNVNSYLSGSALQKINYTKQKGRFLALPPIQKNSSVYLSNQVPKHKKNISRYESELNLVVVPQTSIENLEVVHK